MKKFSVWTPVLVLKIFVYYCMIYTTVVPHGTYWDPIETLYYPPIPDDSFRHISKAAEIFSINFVFIFIVPEF